MQEQKERSRKDAQIYSSDWKEIIYNIETIFVGYDKTSVETKIIKYRQVEHKGKKIYHIVIEYTPFYAESGGQVGDCGYIYSEKEKIEVLNTIKENDLIIHITNQLPENIEATFIAIVDETIRNLTEKNHTATHLLHFALRKVLGNHVEQRGSLVHPDYLRFDFSHPQKMSDEELEQVELMVNEMIWNAISIDEKRHLPIEQAKQIGAIALFGEKYDDVVRVIKFGDSVELCGGTHVKNTATIGLLKIVSESAIAAGIRRVEAITYKKAWQYLQQNNNQLKEIKLLFNNPKDIKKAIQQNFDSSKLIQKKYEELLKEKLKYFKESLIKKQYKLNEYSIIAERIELENTDAIRDLVFQLKNQQENTIVLLACLLENKVHLALGLSDNLINQNKLNASILIKEIAKEINGGGGGQPFFATAGGTNISRINEALKKIDTLLSK